MTERISGRLLPLFLFRVAPVLVFVLLCAVWAVVGPSLAIRGSYVVFALLLAGVVYERRGRLTVPERVASVPVRSLQKLLVACLALGVGVAALTGTRLPVLLVFTPLAYALVTLQYVRGVTPPLLLLQVCATAALTPVTKFLTTGFYFGNGDLFGHARSIEYVAAAGRIDAIAYGESGGLESIYQFFPGYHLLGGVTKLTTGLSGYQTTQLLGTVVVTAFLLPLLYLLARDIADDRYAVCVVLAGAATTELLLYTNYFIPQSLAVPLVVCFLYLLYRATAASGAGSTAHVALAVFAGLTVVSIHHFTVVLVAPALGVVAVAPKLLDRVPLGRPDGRTVQPHYPALLLSGLAVVNYWGFEANRWLLGFENKVRQLLVAPLVSTLDGGGGTSAAGSGGQATSEPTPMSTTEGGAAPVPDEATGEGPTPATGGSTTEGGGAPTTGVPEGGTPSSPTTGAAPANATDPGIQVPPGVADGLGSLLSVDGLYYVLILAFFTAGVAAVLRDTDRYRRGLPVLLVGIAGALLVVKTPFSIKSIGRLRHPYAMFFAFVMGAGVYATLGSKVRRNAVPLGLVVVVLLGAVGPMMAADDVYSLRGDAPTQKDFGSDEFAAVEGVSEYTRRADGTTTSFWVTRLALDHFGDDRTEPLRVANGRLTTDRGLFVYRKQWREHTVLFRPAGSLYLTRFRTGREWLSTTASRTDRVYDGGSVGVLAVANGTAMGDTERLGAG